MITLALNAQLHPAGQFRPVTSAPIKSIFFYFFLQLRYRLTGRPARGFILTFHLVALCFIRMPADYTLIQLSVYIKKKVHKDDQ